MVARNTTESPRPAKFDYHAFFICTVHEQLTVYQCAVRLQDLLFSGAQVGRFFLDHEDINTFDAELAPLHIGLDGSGQGLPQSGEIADYSSS